MTKNKVIQVREDLDDFEANMNAINDEYGSKVFATQTHVSVVGNIMVYTAVFFIRE